jgi:hypothetical protein
MSFQTKNRKSLVGFADATLTAMNALTSVAPPKPKANLCLAQQGWVLMVKIWQVAEKGKSAVRKGVLSQD